MTYLPTLELRTSTIAGTGCFATEDIPKGTIIGEYTGEIISDEEANNRYDESPMEETYLFSIEGEKCIDATNETHPVKYINHCCEPNCEADEDETGRVFYTALEDIKAGEELTVDYQLIADDDDHQPCHCKKLKCRGTMKAPKEEKKESDEKEATSETEN